MRNGKVELLKNPNIIHIDIANNNNDTVRKLKRKLKTNIRTESIPFECVINENTAESNLLF